MDFYDEEISKIKTQLEKLIKSKEKARREIRKRMAHHLSIYRQLKCKHLLL